ncbi:phage tail sheath family protein [Sorangium sp. So ce854]|uniref:phage tail sheath family protein n=1 Tax=Sorangium sp. So ce854 TaxID=3133322 RepID=UPI003F62D1F3
MSRGLPRGAPGIYPLPDEPVRALTGARMDVCAFVGVAPRGPARPPRLDAAWARSPEDEERPPPRSVAVPVESFDAYRRLYGGFEGPGRLPYAVAAFFDQGGARAYIVRVVHEYRKADSTLDEAANAAGVAALELGREAGGGAWAPLLTRSAVPVALRARDEGAWGNALRATLSFAARPLSFEDAEAGALLLPADAGVPAGALLRLTTAGGARALRFVTAVVDEWHPSDPRRRVRAILDEPLASAPATAEVVEGALAVDDGDGRAELHERLGLSSLHPRWLAAVLHAESFLVYPDAAWIGAELDAGDPLLAPLSSRSLGGGVDRYADVVADDFFGAWTPGDPAPGAGVHALLGLPDVASVCAPDLYAPDEVAAPDAPAAPAPTAGPTFERCAPRLAVAAPVPPPPSLDGLRLDPEVPDELAEIVRQQQRLVEVAEASQAFVALLDVPPRLHHRQILRWRESFRSSYAAAYHPWLRASRADDRRGGLVLVNPSAVAAGVIAQRELRSGVPYGPANVLAAGVVDVADVVSPRHHDELHPAGINVFLRERDGVRLAAARTLSRDPAYRQLSVRRLIILLRRTLDQQMQWAVFEPNNASLRADVRHLLHAYLRQLYRADAFQGATEDEAFFVRCDDALNPQRVVDAGQLVIEVGVAPAEPLEFLMLRVTRDGDGTLVVES